MRRVTITIPDGFADEIAAYMAASGYKNRSEALRDLVRLGLNEVKIGNAGSEQSLATLAYVFDHNVRDIPKRLTQAFHNHHEISIATMHVHLDHDNCLELAVLRGKTGEVKEFANAIIAERGVRHGRVSFVPVDVMDAAHTHEIKGGSIDTHSHIHPKA